MSCYDLIGFASGIDFGNFYEPVERFLENNLPNDKKVFFLYTCVKLNGSFTKNIKEKAQKHNAIIMGEYGCKGFNTYGPLRLIGGINKTHPDENDINEALLFLKWILED